VRNYYDGDSEIDILMKLIDNLREEMNGLREEQTTMTTHVERVVNFVRRIELLTVEAEGEENGSPEESTTEK
jgi:hypothetical protein